MNNKMVIISLIIYKPESWSSTSRQKISLSPPTHFLKTGCKFIRRRKKSFDAKLCLTNLTWTVFLRLLMIIFCMGLIAGNIHLPNKKSLKWTYSVLTKSFGSILQRTVSLFKKTLTPDQRSTRTVELFGRVFYFRKKVQRRR